MPQLIIQLTAPNGEPVWIDPASIGKFMASTDHPGGTLLWSAGGTQEVQESPSQILHLLDSATLTFRRLSYKMKRQLRQQQKN